MVSCGVTAEEYNIITSDFSFTIDVVTSASILSDDVKDKKIKPSENAVYHSVAIFHIFL